MQFDCRKSHSFLSFMASSSKLLHALQLIFILLTLSLPFSSSVVSECESEQAGECHDRVESLKLKLVAIASILVASVVGICLPIFSRVIAALRPDRDFFVLVKAFSSGVILATGYMHVLPDSFDSLSSDCLPESPWRKFPFATFIAMLSAVMTLMLDSLALSLYSQRICKIEWRRTTHNEDGKQAHAHGNIVSAGGGKLDDSRTMLLRHRVAAQVLELGIVVHSVVIGLAMGASENKCTIRPLIAALCFHQLFEGMGLGGCILQAEYGFRMKAVMVAFFSTTTPIGIVLGIGLSKVYSETSPTALIVVGILDACSAGLLNYTALVDLLASDFMGSKLQGNVKLQVVGYVAVLAGAGLMSLMAKWA